MAVPRRWAAGQRPAAVWVGDMHDTDRNCSAKAVIVLVGFPSRNYIPYQYRYGIIDFLN